MRLPFTVRQILGETLFATFSMRQTFEVDVRDETSICVPKRSEREKLSPLYHFAFWRHDPLRIVVSCETRSHQSFFRKRIGVSSETGRTFWACETCLTQNGSLTTQLIFQLPRLCLGHFLTNNCLNENILVEKVSQAKLINTNLFKNGRYYYWFEESTRLFSLPTQLFSAIKLFNRPSS